MDEDSDVIVFKRWLEINGAKFSKIEWPSLDTSGGVRGAVAIETISADEVMLEIPGHLLMSPPIAYASNIGPYLKQNKDILKTDLMLSVFIMSERSKGFDSFYYPFLRILPEPGTIATWSDEDLMLLQDDAIHVRSKGRQILVKNTYERTIVALSERHPDIFPLDKFSFENFQFSWFSIMARAFGKRLPWTALVPFADCLNHGNLQTKYDYDVNSNGLFRLFPTGSNCYIKGREVFNSYGRRANDNLLLDYGFSMINNEWDVVDLMLTLPLPPNEQSFNVKKEILHALSLSTALSVGLNNKDYPVRALQFLRIVVLNEEEMKLLLSTLQSVCVTSAQPQREGEGEDHDFKHITPSFLKEEKRTCFNKILSVSNELVAIRTLLSLLTSLVALRETSTADDESLLAEIKSQNTLDSTLEKLELNDMLDGASFENDDKKDMRHVKKNSKELEDGGSQWKLECAVTYRLTRKRIVDMNIQKLCVVETWLVQKSTEDDKENTDNFRVRSSTLLAAVDACSVSLNSSTGWMSSKEGVEDKRAAQGGSGTGRGRRDDGEKEEDDRIKATSVVDDSVTAKKKSRRVCVEKLELELYVRQACSHHLPIQIVRK